MSIRAMNYVWDNSKAEGSALVVLLAIADVCNDEDWSSWMGVPRLSEKARMSERNLQRVLRSLEELGELQIDIGAGKKTAHGSTNLYTIPRFADGVTSTSPGDTHVTRGVTSTSPQEVTPASPRLISSTPSVKDSSSGSDRARETDTAEVFKAYESNIGLITPMTSDKIKDWLKDVPAGWMVDAIAEAVRQNKRSLAYIEGILRRWQLDGRGASTAPATREPEAPATSSNDDQERINQLAAELLDKMPENYLPAMKLEDRARIWRDAGRWAVAKAQVKR